MKTILQLGDILKKMILIKTTSIAQSKTKMNGIILNLNVFTMAVTLTVKVVVT